jgi:hypothetical protein
MDEIRENESLVRMRTIVRNWLASDDWNTTQLIDWFQGYDLPALGHDEEPYLWLVRGIPEADERYPAEKKFASRAAVLLKEQPDVKRPGKRPDQVLYNLLMLCAGLACADELFDPLFEVLERQKTQGNWRGIDLRTALKAALISNQKDSRLLPVWEDALLDGEQRFLAIDEYEFIDATRLMPPSAAKRGEPAVDAIGKALKIVAKRNEHQEMREEIFASAAKKVIDTYPGRPMWGRDLLLQAVQQEWPKWAIETIPGPYPEYVSRIIQNVRNSPFVTARSVNGLITHGFVERECKLPREHPDAHSMEEAHKASVKFLCVGA